MKFKKGDKVQCWGYGSASSHFHNGCLGKVEAIEEEFGCVPKKKPEACIGVIFDNLASLGTEFFHSKQLVLVKGKKK